MSSVSQEHKQVACIKTGSSDLAVGAETEKMADCKPARRGKVVQKAGRDSLRVPREDIEDSLRFDRVVGAECQNVCINARSSCSITSDHIWLSCLSPDVYLHILSPSLNHSIN